MKKFFLVVFLCSAFLLMGTTASAIPNVDPTFQGASPVLVPGNPTFPGYGDDYKIENPYSGDFTIDGFTVSISVFNDPTEGPYFSWSSTGIIDAIYVKGGPNAYLYDYVADVGQGVMFDYYLHAPTNPSGKWAGLSHIEFKGSPVPEPATLLLLGGGLVGLAGFGRKKFKK